MGAHQGMAEGPDQPDVGRAVGRQVRPVLVEDVDARAARQAHASSRARSMRAASIIAASISGPKRALSMFQAARSGRRGRRRAGPRGPGGGAGRRRARAGLRRRCSRPCRAGPPSGSSRRRDRRPPARVTATAQPQSIASMAVIPIACQVEKSQKMSTSFIRSATCRGSSRPARRKGKFFARSSQRPGARRRRGRSPPWGHGDGRSPKDLHGQARAAGRASQGGSCPRGAAGAPARPNAAVGAKEGDVVAGHHRRHLQAEKPTQLSRVPGSW